MSVRPPRAEKVTIAGPVGALEAVLEQPADGEPAGIVVVCHPHPQHGGTMHNKVVHTLARAFLRLGCAALRFNFRGVGASDGVYDDGRGELDDAVAATDWARARFGNGPHWLAGFSFGAAIAIRTAIASHPDGLVCVAPAVSRFASGLEEQPECPWLVVQGDQDDLVDVDTTIEWLNTLRPGPELVVLPGAEHFFHGRLVELREAVTNFLQARGQFAA